MTPESRRARPCIAVACLLIGGCADAQVQSDGARSAETSSSTGMTAPAGFPGAGRSVGDGIYSIEQSRRGEAQYMEICERCHNRHLTGDFLEDAPPLVGEEFLSEWAPWTVGDLFEFLTTEMPPKPKDRRGVTTEVYADILAFILMKNEFPAGEAELPPAFEPLAEIEMK